MKTDFRRCLSIRQPWAWLILRPDLTGAARQAWLAGAGPITRKEVENRTWSTPYRGTLWIHAGLKPDRHAWENMAGNGISLPSLASMQTGGIVGRVLLTGCIARHPSEWFFGPIGWTLENPECTEFEPMAGRLGLFVAGDSINPNPPDHEYTLRLES